MQVKGIHHVSINVADVDEAVRFYVDVLGFRERDDRPDFGFGGAWLDVGTGAAQQVHLIEAPVPESRGQHYAVLVDDLAATVSLLRDRGVEVGNPSPVGTSLQAFLFDPSGNQIELHQTDAA